MGETKLVTKALRDFVFAKMSANQVDPTAAVAVGLDTIESSSGDNVTLNLSNNRFTLKCGIKLTDCGVCGERIHLTYINA